eukprot:TRINITY_DN45046_c0_g1_i1.p1 TRINITY_DN45046_c0_g1~~TRINITY_DN45046_c0_g1_i1.p1  ORF type:complete len:332 (+),score=111.39 TRINITY_DN45046_c0_g1_i1:77-1072(+)
MGKKRKHESDSNSEAERKKKKDTKKIKKKETKKPQNKKDKDRKKKKKKDSKKTKKKVSSSSVSSESSGESSTAREAPAKKSVEQDAGEVVHAVCVLPPVEEGMRRFEFSAQEVGPLGLKFSGGFPPLILSIAPGSFAEKKGVPANFEVHAINGLELVQKNRELVMGGMKQRPVVLDVRPPNWKPKAMVKEMERLKALEKAEREKVMALEEQRRDKVAREQQEVAERQVAERLERQERERQERETLEKRAREARQRNRATVEAFEKALAQDSSTLRKLASDVMTGDYGSDVLGGRKLPLRLFTRRKEVAWTWAGEMMELIGGGVPDMSSSSA